MFEKKPSNRPFYARIEYRAVQALVEQKLAEGYSKQLIYDELKGAGAVSMSYSAFCDYTRGKGDRYHHKKKASPAPKQSQAANKTLSAQPTARKTGPADKSEPFRVERLSLDELI